MSGDEEYVEAPESKALTESNDRAKEVVKFFQKEPLTEEFLRKYEEMKADHEQMGKLLKTMKQTILDSRGPEQETMTVGRMAVFFTDVAGSHKVNWPRLVKDLIGPLEPETLDKYTEPGREEGVRITVRKL